MFCGVLELSGTLPHFFFQRSAWLQFRGNGKPTGLDSANGPQFDLLQEATCLNKSTFSAAQCGYGYRTSVLKSKHRHHLFGAGQPCKSYNMVPLALLRTPVTKEEASWALVFASELSRKSLRGKQFFKQHDGTFHHCLCRFRRGSG